MFMDTKILEKDHMQTIKEMKSGCKNLRESLITTEDWVSLI